MLETKGIQNMSMGLESVRVTRTASIASIEQFREQMEVERDRSERSKLPFSMLVLKPIRGAKRSVGLEAKLQNLMQFLKRRLRSIDSVGQLTGDSVAALLPYTQASGAWRVADDVESYCLDIDLDLEYTVYTYPSPPMDDFNTVDAGAAVVDGRTVLGMESLFCKAMPLSKRLLDVLVAGAGMIAVSPVIAAAAAAIRLESKGPVFYAQWRRGLGGKPFRVLKLRSMYMDADDRKYELAAKNEQDGPAFKIVKDPRITRVGRIIRATSIDELPQLWNVLCGEMSVVGPRPLPCEEADGCEPWQARRHDVTPGITCFWQTRSQKYVTFAKWMRMDLAYIRACSIWTDVKLILRTIPAILFRGTAS